MRVRSLLSAAIVCGVIALVSAQSSPEVKLPPSPAGQAAIEVAGTWEKTDTGGQTYRNGKWIVVNYGATQGQCYVEFGDEWLRDQPLLLRDQMSRAWYQRDGNELAARGLYLDMPAWGYHIFDVTAT